MTNLEVLEPVEVFSVGLHPTDEGQREYTHEDLERIVANFGQLSDPASAVPVLLEPTVVLGHEEDGDENKFWANLSTGIPSVGRVTKLWKQGDKLLARLEDIHPDIQKALAAKMYRKVSAEIYDDFQDQGKSYGMALRRIAFLGGEIPQVKDLADILAHVKMSEKSGKVTRVTFFAEKAMANECPEKFCMEGPNKGKPGPCPGAKKSGASSKGAAKASKQDATSGQPAKGKKPWDVSGKVLDGVSGAINAAPEVAVAGALGAGHVYGLMSGNIPVAASTGALAVQNGVRLMKGQTYSPNVNLRATRDELVKPMPGKDQMIPRGRAKPGSVIDRSRRLYDAARLVAAGRINTKSKMEMVRNRISREMQGLTDAQAVKVAQQLSVPSAEIAKGAKLAVVNAVLGAKQPGALARLRAGIRHKFGFSESKKFCEGCNGDCEKCNKQTFNDEAYYMDRAQMIEALQAMGVDVSMITEQVPDALLEQWLKSVGGGGEEPEPEETFEEEVPDPNAVPAEQPLTPEEEQQMFADDLMPVDPNAIPPEEKPVQAMSSKRFSERLTKFISKQVQEGIRKAKVSAERKETIRQFSERLKAQGKVVPSMLDGTDGKPTLEDVLGLVASHPVQKFGEKRVDPLRLVMEFFENLPPIAKFSEFLKPASKEAVDQDRINSLLAHSQAGKQLLAAKK